jgi:hypothetical protein
MNLANKDLPEELQKPISVLLNEKNLRRAEHYLKKIILAIGIIIAGYYANKDGFFN